VNCSKDFYRIYPENQTVSSKKKRRIPSKDRCLPSKLRTLELKAAREGKAVLVDLAVKVEDGES